MTVRILVGHVLDRLADLPDESVHCVVTSPPYWGLRDYKTEPQVWGGEPGCAHDFAVETLAAYSSKGNWQQAANGKQLATGKIQTRHKGDLNSAREQADSKIERGFCLCGAWRGSLGLEPAPALYIAHLVEIFREVRRVLRRDGTVFLNIGDSYATGAGKAKSPGGGAQGAGWKDKGPAGYRGDHNLDPKNPGLEYGYQPNRMPLPGLKPKDLIGIPWMLAFALRADGWWLRSEITWAKRAPMPESVTDRPTMATEKVFLLTNSAKYFYDAEAVKEPTVSLDPEHLSYRPNSVAIALSGRKEYSAKNEVSMRSYSESGRNMRNWWLLGPEPFPESHFAVFPTAIPRTAILAGTSAKGACPKCAAPWVRVVEKSADTRQSKPYTGAGQKGTPNGSALNFKVVREEGGSSLPTSEITTLGWRPSCRCDAGAPIPATILDCFLGAGTTALVADRLGRDCIGIDLSADYAAMAEGRVRGDAPLFVEIAAL